MTLLVFIYKISCKLDNRCYVGQTAFDVNMRFRQHAKANSVLGRAMRQLGVENFSVEILDCVQHTVADDVEIAWIERLNCRVPNGFNVARGGFPARVLHS